MKLYTIILLITIFSFSAIAQQKKDFADKILDFVIVNLDGESIEIENLYDKTIDYLPEDKDEKLILAEKLKKRGYKVINSGRGNYPPTGARIITLTLSKDDCECEVSKVYYFTTYNSVFVMKEKVSCKAASR